MSKKRAADEALFALESASAAATDPDHPSQLRVNFIQPFVRADCCSERDCALERSLSVTAPLQLDSWIALRDRNAVPCYDAADPDMYRDKRFQCISRTDFMALKEYVVKRMHEHLQHNGAWLGGFAPRIGELHHPLFVQRVRVPSDANVHLIGDIHSSLASLINVLADLRETKGAFDKNFRLAPNHYIVFLGDIVDRGPFGVESLYLVLALIAANFSRVFLLNGNHEDCQTFMQYGFARELHERYVASDGSQGAYTPISLDALVALKDVLNYLPSAIVLQRGNENFQLCHGALTEHADEQQKIAALASIDAEPNAHIEFAFLRNYLRGDVCEPSKPRAVDNLKWGDFNGAIADTGPSARDRFAGDVLEFGHQYTRDYLRHLNLKAVISGHQDLSNFTMLVPPERVDAPPLNVMIEPDVVYNTLHRFRHYQRIQFGTATLVPGLDFLAVNTSSAVQSKGNRALRFDCYLTLERL